MITFTFDNGRELSMPAGVPWLFYFVVVAAVFLYSLNQYVKSRDNAPLSPTWFNLGNPRRIPTWDWMVQILVFVVGAVIFVWLLSPLSH